MHISEVFEEQVLRGQLHWTFITSECNMASVVIEFVLCPSFSCWKCGELIFAFTEGTDVRADVREHMSSVDF